MRSIPYFLSASIAAFVLATTSFALAETTIRYSNWLPTAHPFHKRVILPWTNEISQVTNGRINVEILPKVVGSVPGQFDVARDGLADLTLIVNGYSAGRFKGGEIFELPFLGDNPIALSVAAWRIYNKHLAKLNEYAGTVPLAIWVTGPNQVHTKPGSIKSLSDFKGLKIRVATTSWIPIVNALGGVPVQKPVSQVYELMSTGVVDATFMGLADLKAFNLVDSIPNTLMVPGGIANVSVSIVINEDRWKSISAADREAIRTISGEAFGRKIGQVYYDLDAIGMKAVKAAGNDVSIAEGKLLADLKVALKSVDRSWIAKATKAGLSDAEAVLAEFRAEVSTLEKELAK